MDNQAFGKEAQMKALCLSRKRTQLSRVSGGLFSALVKGRTQAMGGALESNTICCTCCAEQWSSDHIVDYNQELAFTELLLPLGFKFSGAASAL